MGTAELLQQVERAARAEHEARWTAELADVVLAERGIKRQAANSAATHAQAALTAALRAALASGLPSLEIFRAQGRGELAAATAER